MKKEISKQQLYTVIAAVLFLVGAIFMLVSTFGAVNWAFYVGLGIAAIGAVIYILLIIENKKRATSKVPEQTSIQEKNK